jgi:flagellar assembly factor FliW
MQLRTSRFGKITVNVKDAVTFEDGLPGFDGKQRFVFLPHRTAAGQDSPFCWMQSLENGNLAFPVVNPWSVRPDYAPTIPGYAMRQVGIQDVAEQARLYAIVTIPRDEPQKVTVNLLAPVLVNKKSRLGKQVVLQTEEYSIRQSLVEPAAPQAQIAPKNERQLAAAA